MYRRATALATAIILSIGWPHTCRADRTVDVLHYLSPVKRLVVVTKAATHVLNVPDPHAFRLLVTGFYMGAGHKITSPDGFILDYEFYALHDSPLDVAITGIGTTTLRYRTPRFHLSAH